MRAPAGILEQTRTPASPPVHQMPFPRLRRASALAVLVTTPLAAQVSTARATTDTTTGTIPFFPIGDGSASLRGPARSGAYLAAVGRRAIAMGTEEGRMELWSWPVKWLHDFELSFRVPKYTEPIAGRTIATSVTERAEGVTIEYTYEQFTVKQHIFVPLDKPAVIMLLEVDAIRPIDIIAKFTPDVHYMWPAALGGQYLVWNQQAKAFLFSESKRRVNAFLGSPAITQASDVPAHMLSAAPPQFVSWRTTGRQHQCACGLHPDRAGGRHHAPRLGARALPVTAGTRCGAAGVARTAGSRLCAGERAVRHPVTRPAAQPRGRVCEDQPGRVDGLQPRHGLRARCRLWSQRRRQRPARLRLVLRR
jgi:hypothetical protein